MAGLMSAVKRFTQTKVDWKRLEERLHTKDFRNHFKAIAKQHGHYYAVVSSKPAELPKFDFAALKKQVPEYSDVLDSLQKQYESVSIPYGSVPKRYLKDIDDFKEYHDSVVEYNELMCSHLEQKAAEREKKYAAMPPVEQLTRDALVEFMPHVFRDYRFSEHHFLITNDGTIHPDEAKINRLFEIGRDDYDGYTEISIEEQEEEMKETGRKTRHTSPVITKEMIPQ